MSEVDGATLMARSLKQQGIDHLFGVVGFPIGPIATAAQKEGVAYIDMRNEQAASYAAMAYGYLTGRPDACVTVTGPGVVHGLAGLAHAQENVEAALNLLEKAKNPLVLVGKGMAWARAENEVRAFIDRTQIPFVRSPQGKGVVPDDHPLSVAAARTLALQQADVVFLMGARFNWIFHFGQAPRFAKDMKVIQLDIAPEEIHHNKHTEVALVGDGKAIMAQINQALAKRQWFYPKDTPWRAALSKKAADNAAT